MLPLAVGIVLMALLVFGRVIGATQENLLFAREEGWTAAADEKMALTGWPAPSRTSSQRDDGPGPCNCRSSPRD